MHVKIKIILLILWTATTILACKKDKNDSPQDGRPFLPVDGKLIYTFTGTVYQLDLKTNQQSTYFTFNSYGFTNWDMSWDGHFRLTNEREAGVFDAAKLRLIDNKNGKIVREFDYRSPFSNDTDTKAFISPDNNKVLYEPTFDNGIVMTHMDGKMIVHLQAVNVENEPIKFKITDEVLWLPDNSILFTLDNRFIFKSSPPYSTLSLIKEMPYTTWGNIRVNKKGTYLSMMARNHIYVLNLETNEFRQVTESNKSELHADFSPDGNYLLVAKKIGPTYFYWNLVIVPNDGKLYNLENSEEIHVIKPEGESVLPAIDGETFWINP